MIVEAIFNLLFGFPSFILGLLPLPDIPDWFLEAEQYVIGLVQSGSSLVSWTYTKETWNFFLMFIPIVAVCIETYAIVKFIGMIISWFKP